MALKFKTQTAHKSNYGSTRSESSIKYIVIHYTGNNGDTAANKLQHISKAQTGMPLLIILSMVAHMFIILYRSNRWRGLSAVLFPF